MTNVKYEVNGNKLVVEIDLTHNAGRSSSGKSIVIATTHGNVEVAPGIKMGLNVYKKL